MQLYKRLGTSRLHELHESKFPFVSRHEFIRSKFLIFLLMYTGYMTQSTREYNRLLACVIQGLRHADENGGTGTRRQRNQDFLQRVTHTKNRKLSGFGPLFS